MSTTRIPGDRRKPARIIAGDGGRHNPKRGGDLMTLPGKVVFLFDVDNTLLDNDRVHG